MKTQAEYDVAFEWGVDGMRGLGDQASVAVIVDVLSFARGASKVIVLAAGGRWPNGNLDPDSPGWPLSAARTGSEIKSARRRPHHLGALQIHHFQRTDIRAPQSPLDPRPRFRPLIAE